MSAALIYQVSGVMRAVCIMVVHDFEHQSWFGIVACNTGLLRRLVKVP
jgi:hypothetical protein